LPITRYQKMLLLVGPPRSGKGTIGRVLTKMLGKDNVAAPTLAAFESNFGMQSLIGKLVAIISDARLSGRSDQGRIVERLLTISGEDLIQIDRKYLTPVEMQLSSRIMVMTNELPHLTDNSTALANRFMVLMLEKSFLSKEDTGLQDRLNGEISGILNWSIAGLQKLLSLGHLPQPSTSAEAIEDLNDLGSPVKAFVEECCVVEQGATIKKADLYDCWRHWCQQQGRREPGTGASFGRNLKAAFPGLGTKNLREGEARHRWWEGISPTKTTLDAVNKWKRNTMERTGTGSPYHPANN
jgi:putative DNA primase/helicase